MPRISNRKAKAELSERQFNALYEEIRRQVRERFGIEGYDPVVENALIAADPNNALMLRLRLAANEMVAKYVHPQLKQVEVTGAGGGPIEVHSSAVDELLQLVEGLVRDKGSES